MGRPATWRARRPRRAVPQKPGRKAPSWRSGSVSPVAGTAIDGLAATPGHGRVLVAPDDPHALAGPRPLTSLPSSARSPAPGRCCWPASCPRTARRCCSIREDPVRHQPDRQNLHRCGKNPDHPATPAHAPNPPPALAPARDQAHSARPEPAATPCRKRRVCGGLADHGRQILPARERARRAQHRLDACRDVASLTRLRARAPG